MTVRRGGKNTSPAKLKAVRENVAKARRAALAKAKKAHAQRRAGKRGN